MTGQRASLGVICGALVSYGAIGAEPVSVFGLVLQQPLSLHECKFNRDVYIAGMPRERHYLADLTVPCFKREHEADIGTKKSIENDDFIVGNWPENTLPRMVRGGSAYIGVVDGNVEQVEFETLGVSSQAQDLDALMAKFGKPSSLERPVCQDEAGATSSGIEAEWQVGQVLIKYLSCDLGRSAHGIVDVRTQKMTDHARQRREKDEASKKPRVAL
jgi:hypothetical protein